MTRFVARALALIVAGWTTSAAAADLNYGSPYTVYQPLNAYSWAGPYLGGNVGYGWG
ncbi:MAG TPA: porin family protein, partial [Bradyrhizobium sp.]|nr:porin family protein [Bradyrhizobium sp.]